MASVNESIFFHDEHFAWASSPIASLSQCATTRKKTWLNLMMTQDLIAHLTIKLKQSAHWILFAMLVYSQQKYYFIYSRFCLLSLNLSFSLFFSLLSYFVFRIFCPSSTLSLLSLFQSFITNIVYDTVLCVCPSYYWEDETSVKTVYFWAFCF